MVCILNAHPIILLGAISNSLDNLWWYKNLVPNFHRHARLLIMWSHVIYFSRRKKEEMELNDWWTGRWRRRNLGMEIIIVDYSSSLLTWFLLDWIFDSHYLTCTNIMVYKWKRKLKSTSYQPPCWSIITHYCKRQVVLKQRQMQIQG